MKNQRRKGYQWILSVVIGCMVISLCTACGKEKDGQKINASVTGVGYLYNSQYNETQISNSQISKAWEILVAQADDTLEDDAEAVEAGEEGTEDDTEIAEANEEGIEDDMATSGGDEENKETEWNVDFEVVYAEYIYDEEQNNIEIYYPQLNGYVDSAKEERINALIEEDIKKVIGEKNNKDDYTIYCVDFKYEIKFLNEQMISILYSGWHGYYMPGDARLDDMLITSTIDIEEERIITLKDVVIDFGELSEKLLADEFEHITKWEGTTSGYEISWLFEGWDADRLEGTLGEKYYKWYTDGENFIIIIEDRLAEYNEYSICTDAVAHILDADFLKKLEN